MSDEASLDKSQNLRSARSFAVGQAAMALGLALREMKPGEKGHPQGWLTVALINLHDALDFSAKLGERVDDRGADIEKVGAEGDLTSLIAFMRNAACHSNSSRRIAGDYGNRYAYNLMLRAGTMRCGDRIVKNEYDDDAILVFGSTKIYISRNMQRALFAAAGRAGIDAKSDMIHYSNI